MTSLSVVKGGLYTVKTGVCRELFVVELSRVIRPVLYSRRLHLQKKRKRSRFLRSTAGRPRLL